MYQSSESRAIVDAMRKLHDDRKLKTLARSNREAALDQLGLGGVAREAVGNASGGSGEAPAFWN